MITDNGERLLIVSCLTPSVNFRDFLVSAPVLQFVYLPILQGVIIPCLTRNGKRVFGVILGIIPV